MAGRRTKKKARRYASEHRSGKSGIGNALLGPRRARTWRRAITGK